MRGFTCAMTRPPGPVPKSLAAPHAGSDKRRLQDHAIPVRDAFLSVEREQVIFRDGRVENGQGPPWGGELPLITTRGMPGRPPRTAPSFDSVITRTGLSSLARYLRWGSAGRMTVTGQCA
jgi:hypothetical protein